MDPNKPELNPIITGIAVVLSLLAILVLSILIRLSILRRVLMNIGREFAPVAGQNEQPSGGLDPSVIAALPTLVYQPANGLDHGEPVACSVCLGSISENAMVRVLPNCMHMFHAECIDMWLGSHSTCPICRAMAEPRVQPEDSRFEATV